MTTNIQRILHTLILLGGALYFARARVFCDSDNPHMELIHTVCARFMALALAAAAVAALYLQSPEFAICAIGMPCCILICNGMVGNIHLYGMRSWPGDCLYIYRMRFAAGLLIFIFISIEVFLCEV